MIGKTSSRAPYVFADVGGELNISYKIELVLYDGNGARLTEPDTREIRKREFTIGRTQGNDLVLVAGNLFKKHCKIVHEQGQIFLMNDSVTYLNGKIAGRITTLSWGDKIYIGHFQLTILESDTSVVSVPGRALRPAPVEGEPRRDPHPGSGFARKNRARRRKK